MSEPESDPASDGEEAGARPVAAMSYAEASAELDEIVGFFEQRDLDVDQLVGRLVRATEIVEELDRRLRATRLQVEQLVPRLTEVVSGDGSDEEDGGRGPADTPGEQGAPDPEAPPAPEGHGSDAALF